MSQAVEEPRRGGVAEFAELFSSLVDEVERVVQGKRNAIHLAFVGLFAHGHVLIEDVPGVGKTSLAKSMARVIDGRWRRIQFTPDLLPSDVTGASVWHRERADFEFRPGAVFANVLLADEINRASPKTQSALLEAMEEGQVTVDGTPHPLPDPFIVIATQNPIELEGTYPLPEAQLDRFLLRIELGYPDRDAELTILETHGAETITPADLRTVTNSASALAWINALKRIHMAPSLRRYIVDICDATRHHRDLLLGVSPRGAIALQRAGRVYAASTGREYVIPDDIKLLAARVLSHRVVLEPEAAMRGIDANALISGVLDTVPIPRTTP